MNGTARLPTLLQVEEAVRRELAACVRDKSHPWRVCVLATTDGEVGDARSVVLREWDESKQRLVIFTDARSPKVRQVDAHPRGTLVLWSEKLGWQLRLEVLLSVETAGLHVSSRWARLKMSPGAQDYLSPLPPGSPLVHAVQTRESRGHFAVLVAEVQAIDWLELHPDGHRRARFDGEGARWLAP